VSCAGHDMIAACLCFLRVVGVHMATPGLVSVTPWNHADFNRSTTLEVSQFEIRPSHRMDSMTRKEQPCGLGALP
jgi:hypothetical protein